MTDLQLQFSAFGLVASAIFAVVAFQLAPADANGAVPPKRRWNWAAAAAAATALNLGALFELLELERGMPTGGRIGAVVIGVMCAIFVALIAYILNRDVKRGPRWAATASAFTAATIVLAVVVKVVS